jgi:hypothetical protein
MTKICAWYGSYLGGEGPVSHGICSSCLREVFGEDDEEDEELEQERLVGIKHEPVELFEGH